jgi:MFS family permease
VIDVYTLVLASLLLLSGATADRFGRRRISPIGLTAGPKQHARRRRA